MVNSTFAFPVLKYGIQSKKTSSPKKEINLRKYLKKISLAPIQMHEAFCCPVLPFMCMCLCLYFFFVFFFLFFSILLISNCLYNVCWKLAVMFSNSNHISNLWFPFRTDHGYLTRLAPAIFGWPWSSLFCNCVNLLYTTIIFNIWGLNKAVVVVVVKL